MNDGKIGIIGFSGMVGKAAYTALKRKYQIRCGQRHCPSEFQEESNVEFQKVNIFAEESLRDFCRGCDVIINCAGSSYQVGDIIANICNQLKIPYVDAFGINLIENGLKEVQNSCVLGAGCFPGLSGILPLWVHDKYFDISEKMWLVSGGEEKYSFGACADMLLSSIHGFGWNGKYYLNDAIVEEAQENIIEIVLKNEFPKGYVFNPYMNLETKSVAQKLRLKEAHWYNAVANKDLLGILQKSCVDLIKNEPLEEVVKRMIHYSNREEQVLPWYIMAIVMEGIKDNIKQRVKIVIQSRGSYEISGNISAIIAEEILKGSIQPGVKWTWEVLNPKITMEKLIKNQTIEMYSFIDSFDELEEGIV